MSTPKLKQYKVYIEHHVVGDNGFFKTQILKKKGFPRFQEEENESASKFKVGFSVNAFYPGALDTWQSI